VDFLFAYTGRERDEETGLYYYRARYYDPAVGRFVSEDPMGFAAGDTNLVKYVGNRPTTSVDPTGLYDITWRGRWKPEDRKKIEDTLQRICKRCDDLIRDIDQELSTLPDMLSNHPKVGGQLRKLRTIIVSVRDGIKSKSERLVFRHYVFGAGSDAPAKTHLPSLLWPGCAVHPVSK
jgi:RHS repeat-associated protein